MTLLEQIEGTVALLIRRIVSLENRLEAVARSETSGPALHSFSEGGISNEARSQASQAQRRRALELQQAGYKPSQIARQLKVSETTVHRYFRIAGQSKRRKA